MKLNDTYCAPIYRVSERLNFRVTKSDSGKIRLIDLLQNIKKYQKAFGGIYRYKCLNKVINKHKL